MLCWRSANFARSLKPDLSLLRKRPTAQPLGCFPYPPIHAMASSSASSSEPAKTPMRKSHIFPSSSPDLISIHDILSRRSEAPPFKASPRSTAKNLGRPAAAESQSLSAVIESRAGVQLPDEDKNTAIEIEDVSLIEIEAATFQRARNSRAKTTDELQIATSPQQSTSSTTGLKPWKKFMLRDDAKSDFSGQDPGDGQDQVSSVQAGVEPRRARGQSTDEPLHLEPAMARRLDWTPVKQNIIVVDSSSPIDGPSGPSDKGKPSSRAREFEQLLNSYKCTEGLRQGAATTSDDESGTLRKRKRIKTVVQTSDDVENAPPRAKLAKKKARTITDLATAAYKPESQSSLGRMREPKGDCDEPVANKADRSKKPTKAPVKLRKRTATKKSTKDDPSKQVLLPPDEALREVANQDFLFGTSSQLAVEKSPTCLKYLQTAMKESNEAGILDTETWRSSDAEEAPRRRPKLWDAGARDEDGDLFDLELSNLANRSFGKMSASQEKDDPFGYLQQGAGRPALVDLLEDSFSTSKPDDPFSADTTIVLPTTVAGGPEQTEVTQSDQPERTPVDSDPGRPLYDQFTDAQLAKEIKRYGFKPVRLRKARIALLEQCWESQARSSHPSVGIGSSATLATKATRNKGDEEPGTPEGKKRRGRPRKATESTPDPPEPPPSAQPRDSPVRPRGRPKKTVNEVAPTKSAKSAASTWTKQTRAKRGRAGVKQEAAEAPLEIPDSASDGDSDSSVGARSPREASFSPPLVDLVSAADGDGDGPGSSMGSGSELTSMFSHVSKAVKSAPRTTDPAKPSWYEKILLYDPIILEDLTAWLNGGELRRVGYDGEVSVAEVKKWCESRSVCCLKRENLRGQERKRY